MDVRYAPEQVALRDSVAQVVDRLGPTAVGQLDDEERRAKLDAAVTSSGWRELRLSEEPGGAPFTSGVEPAIVAEGLSGGLADAAFLGPTLAAELRRRAGAPTADGPETVALAAGLGALAEAHDGAAPGGAVAVDAAGATSALVLVGGPDGPTLGSVALGTAAPAPDLTRPVAPVAGAVSPVGDRPLSDDDLAGWTALGLALTTAELLGVMQGALDLSVEYAGQRKQYGAAIGSFQAVQHLLADAAVRVEGTRSLALHAAWAVDALPPDEAVAAAAGAKAYATRGARQVCETAIQVHGGIGNTWECLAHVFLRRALLSGDVLGGVGPSLERVLAHHGVAANGIGAA